MNTARGNESKPVIVRAAHPDDSVRGFFILVCFNIILRCIIHARFPFAEVKCLPCKVFISCNPRGKQHFQAMSACSVINRHIDINAAAALRKRRCAGYFQRNRFGIAMKAESVRHHILWHINCFCYRESTTRG